MEKTSGLTFCIAATTSAAPSRIRARSPRDRAIDYPAAPEEAALE